MVEHLVGEHDDLADEIVTSCDSGAGLSQLRVKSSLYGVMAQAKASGDQEGEPLLLLGMELVRTDGIAAARPGMS